jgi:hypothetical protein
VEQAAECLRRIRRALELVAEPDLAYAARSRLQRAVLACTRYAAREVGLPEPTFPRRYEMPPSSPEGLREICEVANRLLDRTQTICQPSEPLDKRWTQGRVEIIAGLERLQELLTLRAGASEQPTGASS